MKTIEERAKARGKRPMTERDYRILHKVSGALPAFEIGYIMGALDQLGLDREAFREWLNNFVNSIYWAIESPDSSKPIGDALFDMFMATQMKDVIEYDDNEND